MRTLLAKLSWMTCDALGSTGMVGENGVCVPSKSPAGVWIKGVNRHCWSTRRIGGYIDRRAPVGGPVNDAQASRSAEKTLQRLVVMRQVQRKILMADLIDAQASRHQVWENCAGLSRHESGVWRVVPGIVAAPLVQPGA